MKKRQKTLTFVVRDYPGRSEEDDIFEEELIEKIKDLINNSGVLEVEDFYESEDSYNVDEEDLYEQAGQIFEELCGAGLDTDWFDWGMDENDSLIIRDKNTDANLFVIRKENGALHITSLVGNTDILATDAETVNEALTDFISGIMQ